MAVLGAKAQFEPLHDAHAIEQLIAVVQFEQPLSEDVMRAGLGAMGQFQDTLKGSHDIRGMGFQVGPGGIFPMASTPNAFPDGSIRFATDEAGVVLRELRLDRQALVFRTQAYTRWDAVWAEASNYFAKILPVLGGSVISAFGLHYIDKFVWHGDPKLCRPGVLFKEDSPYLTKRSLQSEDLWHCHSGQLRSASNVLKRLEVVDIDCSDEPVGTVAGQPTMRRAIRISTAITDRFNEAGYEFGRVECSEAIAVVNESFQLLHVELKRVFQDILSEKYANRVGMIKNANH